MPFGDKYHGTPQGGQPPAPSGFGSRFNTTSPKPTPPKKKGGGGFLGGIGHAAHAVGHVVAKTGEGLVTDAKQWPGGTYDIFKTEGQMLAQTARHPWVSGKNDPNYVGNTKAGKHGADLVHGMEKSVIDSVEHPLRHPDQTLLTGLALLTGGGTLAARAGGLARAGSFSDALKAVAHTPAPKPRLLTVGEKRIPLQPSKNPTIRAAQAAHDVVVQRALDRNPSGRIAAHGTKKLGRSLTETRQYQHGIQSAPAQQLERLGAHLKGDKKAKQAALRLTSENSTPDEAIALHRAQLEKGINPAGQRKQIEILERVKAQGLVKQDEHGHVVIDALKHPDVAELDMRIAHGAKERDRILHETGQMTPEAMQARADRPNVVRSGGEVVSPDAITHSAQGQTSLFDQPTRPGRNYVPWYTDEPKSASSAASRTPSPVVGKVRNLVSKKQPFTGENLLSGNVPDNTTKLVANQMKRAYKFANSDRFRRDIVKAGSDTRRSTRDVLVNTQEMKNATVPHEVQAMLGTRNSTLEEIAGHATAYDAWRTRIFPGLHTKFAEENRQGIGTEAPKGYKWVDKNLLGDLGAPLRVGDKSWLTKKVDSVNAAVTAATVYFKPGHVATRAGTNAMTNIIQGSATPIGMGKSVSLWKDLSHEDRIRALGAAGQGGIASMPAESANAVGRVAHAGAMWWSKNIDAPFRFNSIAYEARRAGITTPAEFSKMLDQMESHKGLTPEEVAKVDGIAKRADREAIAYDRLSEGEKNVMRRVIWFYPWVKGATWFAGNTLLEHPFKSAALGQAATIGAAKAKKDFGPLPGYEKGIFKVGGSKLLPLTVNPATLIPYGTPADVADTLLHFNKPTESQQLSSYFNPALSAAMGAAYHLNSHSAASKGSVLSQIAASLLSTTPEYSLEQALTADKSHNSHRVFPVSNEYALLKFLLGSATPRQMNTPAANHAARSELKNAGLGR